MCLNQPISPQADTNSREICDDDNPMSFIIELFDSVLEPEVDQSVDSWKEASELAQGYMTSDNMSTISGDNLLSSLGLERVVNLIEDTLNSSFRDNLNGILQSNNNTQEQIIGIILQELKQAYLYLLQQKVARSNLPQRLSWLDEEHWEWIRQKVDAIAQADDSIDDRNELIDFLDELNVTPSEKWIFRSKNINLDRVEGGFDEEWQQIKHTIDEYILDNQELNKQVKQVIRTAYKINKCVINQPQGVTFYKLCLNIQSLQKLLNVIVHPANPHYVHQLIRQLELYLQQGFDRSKQSHSMWLMASDNAKNKNNGNPYVKIKLGGRASQTRVILQITEDKQLVFDEWITKQQES